MEFTFTQDQMAFRDSVSRFLMTEAPPELLRDIWETDSGRSPELREKIAARASPASPFPKPKAAWAWATSTGS